MSGAMPPFPHVMARTGTILPLPSLLQHYLLMSALQNGCPLATVTLCQFQNAR